MNDAQGPSLAYHHGFEWPLEALVEPFRVGRGAVRHKDKVDMTELGLDGSEELRRNLYAGHVQEQDPWHHRWFAVFLLSLHQESHTHTQGVSFLCRPVAVTADCLTGSSGMLVSFTLTTL